MLHALLLLSSSFGPDAIKSQIGLKVHLSDALLAAPHAPFVVGRAEVPARKKAEINGVGGKFSASHQERGTVVPNIKSYDRLRSDEQPMLGRESGQEVVDLSGDISPEALRGYRLRLARSAGVLLTDRNTAEFAGAADIQLELDPLSGEIAVVAKRNGASEDLYRSAEHLVASAARKIPWPVALRDRVGRLRVSVEYHSE